MSKRFFSFSKSAILPLLVSFWGSCVFLPKLHEFKILEEDSQSRIVSLESSGGFKSALLTPLLKNRKERYPVLIVLHGAGMNYLSYLKTFRNDALTNRIFVLAPDLYGSREEIRGKYPESLLDLIRHVQRIFPVADQQNGILCVSAGCVGMEDVLERYPSEWRGAIFVAYAPSDRWGEGMALMPPLLFVHGSKDNQFKSANLKRAVEALTQKGFRVKWIEDPKGGHEHKTEWNEKIFNWLNQRN